MRTSVTIEDALYEKALELAGSKVKTPADLLHEAVRTYIRVEAGRRLSALGGSAPDIENSSRRRGEPIE